LSYSTRTMKGESCLRGYYLGGGAITSTALLKQQLVVAVKSSLLLYSLQNSSLLHVQDVGTSQVTGISVSPCNQQQLLVTTADGCLVVWDMTDWMEMRRARVGSSISHLLVSQSKEHVFVVTRETEQEKAVTRIKKLSATDLSHVSDILIIRKPCHNFTISHCGAFILYTRDSRVRVINTHTCATFTRHTHTSNLCTAAIHPNRNIAAVGDSEGKLCILEDWNVKGCEKVATHHWHANAASSLSFAPRSDVLFSGGAESVLVKWLDGEPQFLPRIGAGIRKVLCPESGDTVVLVTEDSMIHVVSLNTWTVKFRICNVLRRGEESSGCNSISAQDTSLLFNSTPGKLQMFDLETRKHKASIDVTLQNLVTSHDRNKKPVYIDITHFKLSADGAWLATVERRDDGFVTPESRLKFWNSEEGTFVLATCIEPPHNKVVTSLTVGYTDLHTAVTTSNDCIVKIWQTNDDKTWVQSHAMKHRHMPAYCSVISRDGSILAVGYKGIVVLYTSQDWEVKAEIVQPINRLEGMFLSGYHLLTSARDMLSVWDLTSLSLSWQVSAAVSHVTQLPDKKFLAFVSRKSVTDAYVFSLESCSPIAVHKFMCPGRVAGAAVIAGCEDAPFAGEGVVVLTTEQELYKLSDTPPPPIALSRVEEEGDIASIFTQLLKISDIKTHQQPDIREDLSASKAASILDVSCSHLPPVSAICSNVLADFLPAK